MMKLIHELRQQYLCISVDRFSLSKNKIERDKKKTTTTDRKEKLSVKTTFIDG